MQLIGMLDSPYVRRVAVAMLSAGIAFDHRPISLFRHIDAFSDLSPMLKAPSLLAEDGTVLVDSGVILDYLSAQSAAIAALKPQGAAAFAALGAALVVMEKAVQIHYERTLRRPQEQSESWRERITGQLSAGLGALEARAPEAFYEARLGHADIAVVCAWSFVQGMVADAIEAETYPRLAAFAARAEALPAFRAAPAVDGAKAEALT